MQAEEGEGGRCTGQVRAAQLELPNRGMTIASFEARFLDYGQAMDTPLPYQR
jgi:hypothetical protein